MPEVPPVSGPDGVGLIEQVDRVFAEDGPLAATFEGFETRPGQRRLASAVAQAFESGGALVAEAGTGIGKTLAYLVPAVLAGRRVLISTGTRNLQDQIFYKDVPALARVLGRDIRAAYMKGRTNYLCRHRFDRLQEASAGLAASDQSWLAHIAEWAAATETGDRAEIDDLPDDSTLWTELTATAEQCLGRECPAYTDCFVTRMREEAAGADVIIVNHHLLCADSAVRQGAFGEVIPECDLAIIDEAHQLEDVVTQYFGMSVSTHRVEELARDAASAIGELPAERGTVAVTIARHVTDVQHAARRLFQAARDELRPPSNSRATLTAEMAGRLRDAADAVVAALGRVASAVGDHESGPESLRGIGTRATDLARDVAVILAADDPAFVHFIEARGRGVILRAAPIDVSAIVRSAVVGDRSATVLTSATLTVAASFEYMLARLGLTGAATLRVPSEFDYRTQAVLFLPPDMPDPRSPAFNPAAAAVIHQLLDRSEGRAFVLFTSYAAMHDVHHRLAGRSAWPLLVQGSAPRTALLRDFRATPHAVLLATSSFWQGIDVAGDALSCVVIDRLPFASPADPLVAARIADIESRGGQPFHDYQVPLATLTLLQGLGRLIRTRTDFGVLAVLDPRLTRMSYGRRFMASLPDAPITDDLEQVQQFFARPAGP